MTQRKEHSWNESDYENRRTPVWVMLTSADTCSKTRMFIFCASRLRHQYWRNSTSARYRHDVMLSTREDVIRRRHELLRLADSSLNHEWSKTASWCLSWRSWCAAALTILSSVIHDIWSSPLNSPFSSPFSYWLDSALLSNNLLGNLI
jgi:hypothetical protein